MEEQGEEGEKEEVEEEGEERGEGEERRMKRKRRHNKFEFACLSGLDKLPFTVVLYTLIRPSYNPFPTFSVNFNHGDHRLPQERGHQKDGLWLFQMRTLTFHCSFFFIISPNIL